ncbi:hypothetical protein ACFSVM_25650, partial [Paenibacillus shunpengii]
MADYRQWKESKKEYKRQRQQKRNKFWLKVFIGMMIIFVPLIIALEFQNQLGDNQEEPQQVEAEQVDTTPLMESYQSSVPFEIIHRVDSSRFYYVQQTEGAVTAESADEILKELYAKEAFSDNGGTLGNVLIYDSK